MVKERLFSIIVLCSIAISLSGCMAARSKKEYRGEAGTYSKGVPSKAAQLRRLLSYKKYPLNVRQTPYKEQNYEGYKTSLLQLQSVGDNGQENNEMRAVFYQSQYPGPKKLFVIVPVWGGSTYPSDGFADSAVKYAGGNVDVIKIDAPEPIIVMEKFEKVKNKKEVVVLLKRLGRRIRNAVINTQRMIAWALKNENIDKKSVTIMGISKGSIIAGLATQVDPQITNAIFVMGGSSPARLVYSCDYYNVGETLEKNLHWSQDKAFPVFQHYLGIYNVYNLPTRLNPSHVLIFESTRDACFLAINRRDLWLAMGQPTIIGFPHGHQVSFASMTLAGGYYMRHKVNEFLAKGHT